MVEQNLLISLASLKRVLVTDCGSTTTKALLFERTADGWRQTARGEAPTTVEKPVADVTVGAYNAFQEVAELATLPLFRLTAGDNNDRSSPLDPNVIDLYLSTSSAGGGLQMVVTGVVGGLSSQSAERAALGAGAIVMDVFSMDDARRDYQVVAALRQLRPDIILMAGGYEGGASLSVIEMAELIRVAAPRPRFGTNIKLPIVYAGNSAIATEIGDVLGTDADLTVVQNVRPEMGREELTEARGVIHELFLSHVMSQSPGYSDLVSWSPYPVVPTPAAVGDMVQVYAEKSGKQVLCVDIGGATTDVFSVCADRDGTPVFNRTVSANLGMSYSVANVLHEAGVDNIVRWLPYTTTPSAVRDVLRNKMVRPTSIPQTLDDLWLEHAVCREALRLSFLHHKDFSQVVSRKSSGGISSIFHQSAARYQIVTSGSLDVVIGSGGVLSHAPNRLSAMIMMVDGFALTGVTELCVDSIFMMPHLGVFSRVLPDAALEIFERDCLVPLGVAIAPTVPDSLKIPSLAEVTVNGQNIGVISRGSLILIKNSQSREADLTVRPLHRSVDVGSGRGKSYTRRVTVGEVGFLLDGRGRPLTNRYVNPEFQKKLYRQLELI